MTRRRQLILFPVLLLGLASAVALASGAGAGPLDQEAPERQARSSQPPQFIDAKIVWRGDYENGFDGWRLQEVTRQLPSFTEESLRRRRCQRGRDFSGEDRLQIVTSPVRQGRYAARFAVYDGDRPICSDGNRTQHWRPSLNESEGDENYYRWSTQLAHDFPVITDTYQVITQWHGPAHTQPPIYVFVAGNAIGFRMVEHENGRRLPSRTLWTAPVNRGKWHDFVVHVKWSYNRSRGFVELWHRLEGERRYTQVVPKTFGRTLVIEDEGIYFNPGYYRGPNAGPPGVLFHDGWTQMEVR